MFEISPSPMQEFQRACEDRFRERLLDLLCHQFPGHSSDATATALVVDRAVDDARAAGLLSERAIAGYVIAAFVLGMGIKDDPDFIREVRESGRNEAEKFDWIEGWVGAVAEALEG